LHIRRRCGYFPMTTLSAPLAVPMPAAPPWRGWLPVVLLPPAVVLLVPHHWPRWLFMWLLVIGLYAGLKWLTWRRTPAAGAPWWRHVGYLALWPGLDAPAFLGVAGKPAPARPAASEWWFAAAKLGLGVALLWVVAPLVPRRWEIVLGWVGMTGIVFVLHFGLAHLASCLWRTLGVDARPLMNWPIAATSVSDFWGRRWNTAFRDLTHRFFFAPLLRRVGPAWALGVGFLFSGLIHDLVISVPARGGWGRPTLFFLVQGAAIFIERSPLGRTLGLGRGWSGWLFTMLVLLLPAYGLFHPPFIREVVIPFLEAIGAAGTSTLTSDL
jgi:hypothetical protein